MKTYFLVLTLILFTGCLSPYWSEERKREGTDYAVGQKYELLQDIMVSKYGHARIIRTRTDDGYPVRDGGAYIVPKGTQLKMTKMEFRNDRFSIGKYVHDEAVIISGDMTGKIVSVFLISKHPDRGGKWSGFMFVDDSLMKRVD